MTAANTYTPATTAGLYGAANVLECTVSTAAANAAAGKYLVITSIKCDEGYGAIGKLATET